jgi:hypothetical protein
MTLLKHALNQRGLAVLCGVQNAHIGTISAGWSQSPPTPRVQSIMNILEKMGGTPDTAHYEFTHKGVKHHCYPANVCLAVLEYYAFDAGSNCQEEARNNFRLLAGSKLQDLIYRQTGYDPSGKNRFDKWHERIALNHKSAPNGYFHVFNEAGSMIYELIQAGAEIDEHFVVDISVGIHWSKYWDANDLDAKYGERDKYPHRYPESHPQAMSNPQVSWCYPGDALGEFRRWMQSEYIDGGKFSSYLMTKVKNNQLAPSFAELAIATLKQDQLPPPA